MITVAVSNPAPHVTQLTLDRPERLNAMTAELVQDLLDAFDAVAGDPSCRAVILTGSGRAFCAGFDLRGYGELPGDAERGKVQRDMAMQQHIASLVPRMRALPQPIIAAVNGPATGGGLALVLASDIRLASTSARFNAAFVRIGLSGCDIATSWILPRLVGAGRAHELMLTGRFVDAREAAAIGLVLEAVPDEELLGRALAEADLIAANAPMGVTMTKQVMWSALEVSSEQAAVELENRTQVMLLQTADHLEAKQAFLDKRLPNFRNA